MNMSVSTMQRKVRKLQDELGRLGPVMRGSVVVIGTRNKQPYFSLNKDKRTYLIYLGQKRVMRALQCSRNYKRLLSGEKQKRKVGASKSGKCVERAKAEYDLYVLVDW